MLEAAFAQMRLAASLAFGLPFSTRSLNRIVDALLDTRREFGSVGPQGDELLAGPALDEQTRRDIQLRRFRSQAARAARETAYYRDLFERIGLDAARLRAEDIPRIPPTPKAALRDDPDAFVCRSASPVFRTTTTGTTGRPTGVCFSAREMSAYGALEAIHSLTHGTIGSEDIVLISSSARATLGNTCFAGGCARVGAQVALGGLIDPALTLALLAEPRRLTGKKPRVSVLSIYPSYLGELVTCGLRLGYRPADFGLERIYCGGEIVTAGLKDRCRRLFGDEVRLAEGYGMTEPWPLGGTACEQGHLHFEPAHGLVEVLGLESGAASGPGEAGSLVLTPFPPFRETTILLRYDTEDIVRPVAPPSCALRHLPATGNILGKLRHAARHDGGWTFPRDVLEALEAVEALPLPARCGFWAVPGGVAVEVVAERDEPRIRRAIERGLADRGVPARELRLVDDPARLRYPLPLRCDLRELSFSSPPDPERGARAAPKPITDTSFQASRS